MKRGEEIQSQILENEGTSVAVIFKIERRRYISESH
jgi:hypothetical protein